jgi:hypothetical protein
MSGDYDRSGYGGGRGGGEDNWSSLPEDSATYRLAERLRGYGVSLTPDALDHLFSREVWRDSEVQIRTIEPLWQRDQLFEQKLNELSLMVTPGQMLDRRALLNLFRGLCPGFPPFC